MGGTTMRLPFTMSGSGSAFIYGWCDANYKENMTKQEAMEFVQTAVTLAMHRDNSSGGIIRTMDITKDGHERGIIKFNDLKFPKPL